MTEPTSGSEGTIETIEATAEVKQSGEPRQKTLADLKVLRSNTKRNLTRTKNLIDSKGNSLSTTELECRLGILESYFKQILNVQTSIEKYNVEDEEEANDSFRSEVEDLYISSKSRILELLSSLKDNSVLGETFNMTQFHQQPILRSKLEQIKLPTFSGKFSEYPNFIGLFMKLVDKDETLDNLQKFNYLKRSLTGAALGAVREFDMIGTNYKKALQRLASRFDNKRLIFQEHINALLDIPKIPKPTANLLRSLEDSFNTHLTAMLSIGNYENITNAILISLASDRVDSETLSKWQEAIDYNELPSWKEFTAVLDRRCRNLEAKESKMNNADGKSVASKPAKETRFGLRSGDRRHTALTTQKVECTFCNLEGHQIESCSQFQELTVANRFHETKKRVLCINCLGKGHSVRRCSKTKCSICSLPHHHLLHRFSPNVSANEPVESSRGSRQTTLMGRAPNQVILATAVIEVRDSSGVYHPVRALLDSASQLNFVTEYMAQILKLKRNKVEAEVSGIGNEISKIRHRTHAICKSRISDFEIELDLLIIKAITDLQPNKSFNIDSWDIPKNIVLADPQFNRASKIDMLIGAECFFELLSIGQIKLEGRPTLQKTLLGWVVSGRYDLSMVPNATVCLVGEQINQEDIFLKEKVEQFWKMESVETKAKFLSQEEVECEEHFKRTVLQNDEGRFVVRLPFKTNPVVLGDSLEMATRRFYAIERKLERKPEMKKDYCNFMKEYEELNHMQEAVEDQMKYFSPHQCVLRPESSTTKLRVVFDCSARTSTNISLNDILMKGPVVQDTLFAIVIRFRCFRYALTADISKMYRQIIVDEKDRKYQCVLWRSDSLEKLKGYQLNTVTYGTTSAPYLATRCLKLLAEKSSEALPIGSKVINEDFYMDDLISGGDSAEEIDQIYKEVKLILKGAGFELRKWWTNENVLLNKIPSGDKEVPLRINDSDIIKTLGIKWNPSTDQLQYMVPKISYSKTITKRIILSELSTLFDPLGLINPVIVKGKIILQSLWIQKTNWDESVQARIYEEWMLFRRRLKELDSVNVPRYILTPHFRRVEIHGFADASLKAYGCCVYLRTTEKEIGCHLLAAKSRVAPIKTQSLPRLELCAAELLVMLLKTILPNLQHLFIDQVYLWTDSEIVLCWLSAHPSTWDVFIANRVSKIQTELPEARWRHVNSKQNPADIISRGAFGDELNNSIWFKGPKFLYCPSNQWPNQKDFSNVDPNTPGRRKKDTSLLTTFVCENFSQKYLQFSDVQKTCRIFGYVVKFIQALKESKQKGEIRMKPSQSTNFLSNGPTQTKVNLTVTEIDDALLRIIWHIQRNSFREEISLMNKDKLISPKSFVKNLNPFLDDSLLKLIRVGGRLQNADLPYSAKCPILLPKSNPFIYNYVLYLHRKNYHAGAQTLTGIIRQRFWILDVRRLTKKVVSECVHCFKYRPKLLSQIMGSLPLDRVQPARPFLKTGVDFCGPVYITQKLRGQRVCKAYVAVFICFVVKAVHMEVVSDLTSQSFIAALKRFVARRGLCRELFCDNATNFVGARNELNEFKNQFFQQQKQDKIAAWCTGEHIQFKHIPPRAPHFGGLWEAAVKSAKSHLLRTLGQTRLTFEELTTVVADIEAILNSRPICEMSSDPSDEQVLTPGHFLIGGPLNAIPEPSVVNEKIPCLRRWRHLTQIKQHFWSRWSSEYLLGLQKRAKWQSSSNNIQIGDVVLIAEDNISPQQWLLGKVINTLASTDGKVRVVDLKTKSGVLRRAIHRLAPLPVYD